MLTFNAIDVETANADRASICQIGIVHVAEGEIVDQWKTLVNPEDWFDAMNVSIHGIDEADVEHSPTMPQIRNELRRRLRGSILVSHTSFDRTAFERAMRKYDLEQLQVRWLDSAKVVRRAWPDSYATRGYGLASVAHDLEITFEHHDALEDARAVAEIVLRACRATDSDIEDLLRRVELPISSQGLIARRTKAKALPASREPNEHGPLFEENEVCLFTGQLSIERSRAADVAAYAGCRVVNHASNRVTRLIVGKQDAIRLKGYDKSSKHRSIEKLIANGADIEICSEEDWIAVLKIAFPEEDLAQRLNELDTHMAPLKARLEERKNRRRVTHVKRRLLHSALSNLKKGWCKGAMARDENGHPVEKRSKNASSWSLDGAILSGDVSSEGDGETVSRGIMEANRAVAEVLLQLGKLTSTENDSLASVNDHKLSSQHEAVSVLKSAVQQVRLERLEVERELSQAENEHRSKGKQRGVSSTMVELFDRL